MVVMTEDAYIGFLAELISGLRAHASDSAEAEAALAQATEFLKKLRTVRQLKAGLADRDPLGRDSNIATERYQHERLIASITTDVDQLLVPAISRVINTVRSGAGAGDTVEQLSALIARAPRATEDPQIVLPDGGKQWASSPSSAVPQLTRGLLVMQEMDSSTMRELVQIYGPDFRVARDGLARFAVYKALHAQLHTLRCQHYE